MPAEISAEAAAAATRAMRSEEPLDLVLELEPVAVDTSPGSRGEVIARQKAQFDTLAEPVKAGVLRLGGTIEGQAWIAGTLKARIPARALERLRQVRGIVKIDISRAIVREG